MSVQIAAGDLDTGGYVGETAGGTKFAVFRQSANLVAYKSIDGTPAIIGSAQTPMDVFTDNNGTLVALDAVIDSADVVHVVAYNGVTDGDEVVYNTISDPDGTPAWGTWEAAFNVDQTPNSSGISYRVTIQVDSNDKPHILLMETTKFMGVNRSQIYHVDKTGASWSTGTEISSAADADYFLGPRSLAMKASDDMEAYYWDLTSSDAYNSTYTGTWSTESDLTWTNVGQPRFGSGAHVDSGATLRRYIVTQASPPLIYEEDTSTAAEVGSISAETQQFGIALNGTDRYLIYVNADDDIEVEENTGSGWSSASVEQTGTWQQAICGWSYLNLNNTTAIDYLFSNATNVWWDEYALSGDITIVVDELTLAGSAETITVVPGAVSQLMDELTLAGSAETIVVSFSLVMDELTLAGSAETTVVSFSLVMDELTLAGSAETITVDAPVNDRRPEASRLVQPNGTALLAAIYRA